MLSVRADYDSASATSSNAAEVDRRQDDAKGDELQEVAGQTSEFHVNEIACTVALDAPGALGASRVLVQSDLATASCAKLLASGRGVAGEKGRADQGHAYHPWLSMTAIARDRHLSSGSTFGLGADALNSGRNKRWSVAGAAPELTLMRGKLDDVQRELRELHSKHEVTTMEYEHVLNELECCRQSKARIEQEVHDVKMDAMRWKKDYELLLQQKQFVDSQLADSQAKLHAKQLEIDQSRRQCCSVLSEISAHGQSDSALIAAAEYEELSIETNGLKERCCLLEGEVVELRGCFRLAQEEFRHLYMNREEELEMKRRKIGALEERQVALYQQLHQLAQGRDILRSENDVLKQQLQDLCSDMTRSAKGRKKLEEDMCMMRRQHDGVLSEYHHVMSERDSVLKENEHVTEEKGVLLKKLKASESDRQALLEQLKTVEMKLDAVHRERQELQRRLDDQVTTASNEQSIAGTHFGHFAEGKRLGGGGLETASLLGAGDKRLDDDDLRLIADRLKGELTNAVQEMQGAKQQRDWALAERQRVVSEREEMRMASETLRSERDQAVTNLANAIRDVDNLRRQREHVERELRRCRELMESGDHRRLNVADSGNVDSTPSNSHDSAIDTDMAEWEVETLQFNMDGGCQKNEEMGLTLGGGRDDPIRGHVVPIYVKSVAPGTRLDGMLRAYDCIMQVNNIDVSLMDRRSVVDILRNSNSVKMAVRRRRLVGMKLISVPLTTASDGDVGIVFEDGVYVSKLKTSSPAAKAGNLAVGDRLIYVNDIPVQNRSAQSVADLIRSFKDCGLVLAVMKSPPVLSPMTPVGSGYAYFATTNNSSASNNKYQARYESRFLYSSTLSRRDASVQVSMAEPPHVKKHDSLLDKVQEKLFGRGDRKSLIRALVSNQHDSSVDSNSDMAKRSRPSSSTSHRRPRPISVHGNYTVVDRSKCTMAAEQQVLQQLDSILEASEKEQPENRVLEQMLNFHRSAAGGTWPKYKPTTTVPCSPEATPGKMCTATVHLPMDKRKQNSTWSTREKMSLFTGAERYKCEAKMRGNIAPSAKASARCAVSSSVGGRPVSYHPFSIFNEHGSYKTLGGRADRSFLGRPMSPLASCRSDADGDLSTSGMSVFKQHLQLAHAMPVVAGPASYLARNDSGSNAPMSLDHELDRRSIYSQSSDSRTPAFGTADQSTSSTKSLCNRIGLHHHHHHALLSFSSSEDCGDRMGKGDVRTLHIEKRSSHEGLGISIASSGTGVFVSSVSEKSLAARHGLQVGDQLLEVCGINMRSANIQHASNVLSHLGRSEQITLMVQYNPTKYTREMSDYRSSGCSTPKALVAHKAFFGQDSSSTASNHGGAAHSHEFLNAYYTEPRFVFIKRDYEDWGFALVGGNAVGIFIDDIKLLSLGVGGLRSGDQILEFDGVNFRKLTLEQALYELSTRTIGTEVSLLVQYNEAKYRQCKLGVSDSFYVRATIDRQAENTDELSFKAGDILRVDNTVFNGVLGLWRAWLVDQEGRERSCGIIPSKNRLEEEVLFRRSGSEISTLEAGAAGGGGEAGTNSRKGTIRRSLKFIRRSSRSGNQHQRTSSKESRDMDSDSPAPIDELYQRVNRIDYKQKRPVLIMGALVEVIVLKLLEEYPKLFAQCVPECVKPMPVAALEQGLKQNVYVDYRKRDKLFEITRVAVVKDLIEKGYHCVLHVGPTAVERLHRLNIYPVVIFIKLKGAKQIKELCDDRLTNKQAKEMFEAANKVSSDFCHLFSAVISGPHHSIKQICQQIACTVEHEQKKTLWIISGESM